MMGACEEAAIELLGRRLEPERDHLAIFRALTFVAVPVESSLIRLKHSLSAQVPQCLSHEGLTIPLRGISEQADRLAPHP